MRRTDVLLNASWVRAQLNDGRLMLAYVNEDNSERASRRLLCSCHHQQYAHRHYRPGSECALCKCQHWSPAA